MILDARESRDHQLSRAPKIIKILRLVFAGDDLKKICFQIIDEIPWILIGIMQKTYTEKKHHKKTKLYY